MIKLPVVLIVLFLIQCVPVKEKSNNHTDDMSKLLAVKLSIPDTEMKEHDPFVVNIEVENISNYRILVNSRLAVGFEDDISREIYFHMTDLESGEPIKLIPIDINREEPEKEDYKFLENGESISVKFNLLNFYVPESKGKLSLVAFYQADEEALNRPDSVVNGVFVSNRVNVEYR